MMNVTIRQLPGHPDLRLLENEASELLENGSCTTQAEARFKLAHLYGFQRWPKLEAYVSSIGSMGELEQAIQDDDVERVKRILDEDPGLIHREGHWVKRRRHNGYLVATLRRPTMPEDSSTRI